MACCAGVLLAGLPASGIAQTPSVLKVPATKADSAAVPSRSLEEWRSEIELRLKEAEAETERAKKQENAPPTTLSRELEVLARIDLLLTQLSDKQAKQKKLKADHENLKKELDRLVQLGLREDEQTSFLQLDAVRDELRAEQNRLKRMKEKERTAITASDTAQQELKEKDSARRLAKENFESNDNDSQRKELSDALAETVRQAELAEATAQLRKQEAANAKAATQLQELQVKLLKEKEARLQSVVDFDSQELDDIIREIDRQEDQLKAEAARLEGAATNLKYLDDQWMRAQRQLDASNGDEPVLREEVKAYQLGRRAMQQRLPLLRSQLERLSTRRTLWKRRQQAFSGQPARKDVRDWTKASEDALAQLQPEERAQTLEIEDIRDELEPLEQDFKELDKRSPRASWLGKQLEHLRSLRESHQADLDSIQATSRLHKKLLAALATDSLAATAKDRVTDLWNSVESIWNYELTSFGDDFVTVQKVVTALLVLLAGMIFSRALSRALGRQVLRRLDIDASASATIQSLFYYVLLLMFGLIALNVAKVPLTAFTVLGGAVALGVGFGSQNIINNFISGLILLAERPVKVGDLIQLDNPQGDRLYGNIEHIGARSTRVRTGSNLEIIVPNSSFLQNNVVNFTLSSDKVRTKVEVGVIYGSPTVTVTQLLRRAVIETGRVAKDPPPIILFKNFGDNSLLFEVHFWLRMRTMMDQMQIESAVRFRIDQLFREEGIVIAFPQRDIHLDTTAPLDVRIASPEDITPDDKTRPSLS